MNEFATRLPHHWEADSHIRVPTRPSQVLLWTTDGDGRADFISPSWTRYTGLHRKDLLGAGWLQAVHTEDLSGLTRAFRQSALESQGFRRKLRLRRNDGVYCGMVIESLPRTDVKGEPLGFAGFCLDLSPAEHSLLAPNLADHRISDLIQQTRLPALALDPHGTIIFFNQPFLDTVGDPAREVICRPFFERFTALKSPPESPLSLLRTTADTPPHTFEATILTTDRGQRLFSWHVTALRNEDDQISCAILVGDDITAQKAAEEQLLLTQRVFESTEQAMLITDANAAIISINEAFTRLTGYAATEVFGMNPRVLQSGRHGQAFYDQMWRELSERGNWHGDIWDRRKDGSFYPKFLSISTIKDEHGNLTHYCGIFHDISERKRIEDQLDRLAHYDSLTGIPNRTLLFDRLELSISQALRSGGEVAIFFIDLDHFKEVNDSLGHDYGDRLLKLVAERISECIRSVDTVARLGGDEFAVILPDVRAHANAARVAEKIVLRLQSPFLIEGVNCEVSPSIGISLYPSDHHDPEQLLKCADRAMYSVKAAGRGAYRFYHDIATEDAPPD